MSYITQVLLRKLFILNEEAGELIWKEHRVKSISAKLKGTIAGDPGPDGRIRIKIDGKWYGRSHLVYLYKYGGSLPSVVIQKDGDLTNDRSENLRKIFDFPDKEISQDFLRKAFHLKEGKLFRKFEERGEVVVEGKPAGGIGPDGRWVIRVLNKLELRAHLIYLYEYGVLPSLIKHLGDDLADDRPENLRLVSRSQVRMSSRGWLARDLRKGVSRRYDKEREKPFFARIKGRYLGSFETVEDAAAAYDAAARDLFGKHARRNNLEL